MKQRVSSRNDTWVKRYQGDGYQADRHQDKQNQGNRYQANGNQTDWNQDKQNQGNRYQTYRNKNHPQAVY
jgi:hypothetical protein